MRMTVLLLTGALALALAACDAAVEQIAEEAAERAVEADGGGDVEVDVDDDGGDISVETDEGSLQVAVGDDADLPADFPEEVPLPDDFVVLSASSFTDDSGSSFLVSLQTEGLDVVAYLEQEVVPALEAAGYEIIGRTTNSTDAGTFANVAAESAATSVNVTAQDQGEGQQVVAVQVFPVE